MSREKKIVTAKIDESELAHTIFCYENGRFSTKQSREAAEKIMEPISRSEVLGLDALDKIIIDSLAEQGDVLRKGQARGLGVLRIVQGRKYSRNDNFYKPAERQPTTDVIEPEVTHVQDDESVDVPKWKKDEASRVVGMENLAPAIMNSYREHNMTRDDAETMAYHVLNFFGFGDRIVDNILEPEDRDLFYMLEDFGLLVTERDETTLHNGREWRINYWLLKRHSIFEMAESSKGDSSGAEKSDPNIYDDLPKDAWDRQDGDDSGADIPMTGVGNYNKTAPSQATEK